MPEIEFKSLFRRDIKKYISKQKPESFFLFVIVPDSDRDNNLKKDRNLIAQMGMTPMGKPGSPEAGFIDDRGDAATVALRHPLPPCAMRSLQVWTTRRPGTFWKRSINGRALRRLSYGRTASSRVKIVERGNDGGK